MVHDSAQIRRRGAYDFMAYYEFACARQESVPLPAVTMNLDKGMLDFNGDRVKLLDWPPILDSITINKQLHHIAISSTYQAGLGSGDADRRFYKSSLKKRIPAIRSKDMTFKLCKALRDCLTVSPNLKTLQLNGLPLRERDLIVLTKGFAKSVSLENLSLANCPISDEGLEIICQSVKYSTCIRTVDFTGCNLTWRGAEHMASIIKHQGMQRHGTAWAESLRYRQPHFEGMAGLRRVTLNCNTLIGDRGAAALANELAEDLWVKAVDLQRCGLSNEGARRLLESLKTNSALSVLDVRNNPLIDKVLIKTILEKVLMNADGESPGYCWIKPAEPQPQRAAGLRRRPLLSSVRGKTTLRIAASRKGTSSGMWSSGAAQQKPGSRSRNVPWRAAARAGRQRGLPPGTTVVDQSFQGAATVKVTVETDSEEDEEEEEVVKVEQKPKSSPVQEKITERQFGRIQMELRECRLMLAEERRARLQVESRLMEFELENARLRSTNLTLSEALASGSASAPAALGALEDEAVLDSIENSFKKFHAFLDLLRDAGLGQLASMAGIEKSDFQPIGKPQLSSTIGPFLEEPMSLNQRMNQFGGIPTKTNASVKAFSVPSSSVVPLHEDRQRDVTFLLAAGLNGESGGGDKDKHTKPNHESGSEHSLFSQKSLQGASLRKTSQSHPLPRNSKSNSEFNRSNSRHSNGSHSYSFDNTQSNGCQSNGSYGRLSAKSSISEVISDKAESVRSSGSKRKDRQETEGRPWSGGSSSSEHAGKHFLEQITGQGGRSDGTFY